MWSNKRIGPDHIAAHLDRVLVNTHLLSSHLESKLLCSAISDHKPICLFFPPLENLGPLPFHFNHLWLEADGVKDIIAEACHYSFLDLQLSLGNKRLKESNKPSNHG